MSSARIKTIFGFSGRPAVALTACGSAADAVAALTVLRKSRRFTADSNIPSSVLLTADELPCRAYQSRSASFKKMRVVEGGAVSGWLATQCVFPEYIVRAGGGNSFVWVVKLRRVHVTLFCYDGSRLVAEDCRLDVDEITA